MSDLSSLDVLKAEWLALFDRVLAHGRRAGRTDALATLLANAQAQMDAVEISPGRTDLEPSSRRSKQPNVSAKREGKRAPSGSIQREVQAILAKSLVPLRVQQIMDAAGDGSPLKDTSVRMALMTLRKNGKVRQNDIAEWSLTPRSSTELSQVPSDDGHHAIREAA